MCVFAAEVLPTSQEIQSGSGVTNTLCAPAKHSAGLSGEQALCAQVKPKQALRRRNHLKDKNALMIALFLFPLFSLINFMLDKVLSRLFVCDCVCVCVCVLSAGTSLPETS